ncbi:MAG: DNA polymerase/3'-5' exonuclease PolX [Fibrobacter sp.]|mgnify:CR=1 FL=1|nr:DNA polymerase/3'-5' exonuclease PolX [Fibrobacter sp.]
MRVNNSAVSAIFDDMADLLEIEGENPFRVRAYRTASRTISGLSQDVSELIADTQDLTKLPGIGKDLAAKIYEIVTTGHLSALDEIKKRVNPRLIEYMRIAGLGGKRVSALNSKLGIFNLKQLETAARNHKICKLPGFGEKVERSILQGIKRARDYGKRIMLPEAEEIAESVIRHLRESKGIGKVVVAGSFRRRRETVRDLDIMVTAGNSSDVSGRFLSFPQISRVISRGETRTTVILNSGIQVDIRVVPEESYGSALHYFTGSKSHNIGVRKLGVKAGLKINEYGVFKGQRRICGQSEEEVYESVGLPFIEPELREDTGELEAARNGLLPNLIELTDIKGDLHSHTSRTDGHATIEEMVSAARAKGYEYLAITDHSKHLAMTHGLKESDLEGQIEHIDRLNETLEGFTVLKGIEVDIMEDGSLDLSDSVLKRLDVVVCSVHYKFNLSRDKQTKRVLKAMDNQYFNILAHPTGRLINKREPFEIDIEAIIRGAKERGCILELNSYPERLDLNETHCRLAKEMKVKISIDTDSHSTGDLDFMRFGVGQARRGWLEKDDVINTRSLSDVRKLLKRK